jgi:hypothetical protein
MSSILAPATQQDPITKQNKTKQKSLSWFTNHPDDSGQQGMP